MKFYKIKNKNKLKNVKVIKKKEELELNEIDYSKVGNFGGVGKYESSSKKLLKIKSVKLKS